MINKKKKEQKRKYYLKNREKFLKRVRKYHQEHKEEEKEYIEKNRERINKQRRDYRKKNKEKINKQKREYYKKNKVRLKKHDKEYREKHKERIRRQKAESQKRHKGKTRERNSRYRQKHKTKVRETNRNYRRKYLEQIQKKERRRYQQCKKAWLIFFKEKYEKIPKCEICRKWLRYFGSLKEKGETVSWDTKDIPHEKLPIKIISNWLSSNKPDSINVKIWENSGFGLLCPSCNFKLQQPGFNRRKERLLKTKKYIERSADLLHSNVKYKRRIYKKGKLGYRNSWLPYLIDLYGKKPYCMIDSKHLRYFSRKRERTVCFDHTSEDGFERDPSVFLRGYPPTKKNFKRFKKYNFGILCDSCNRSLPTKKREKWIEEALKYIERT